MIGKYWSTLNLLDGSSEVSSDRSSPSNCTIFFLSCYFFNLVHPRPDTMRKLGSNKSIRAITSFYILLYIFQLVFYIAGAAVK